MADQWLCLIDGQKLGPLSFTRLQQLAESGRLKGEDYVRPATDDNWLAAKNVPNLFPAPTISVDQAEMNVPAPKRRSANALPVAQALDDSTIAAGIPRGKAVSAGPPSGKLAAAPPSVSASFLISDAKAGKSGIGLLQDRKRKRIANPLIIGGAAAASVLAVLLVLLLSGVIDLSGTGTPVASADTNARPVKDAGIEFDGEEENPEGVDAKSNTAELKSATLTTTAAAGKTNNQALSTVKQFRDISKLRNIKLPPAQLTVTGLWLSASEQGEPYVAAAEGADREASRFLVIKLQIDNAPGAAPMNYQGWGDEAVLFDAADQAILPLPPSKGKDRIVKQRIEPGGSLVDTLVFPLASDDFEKLRLVLPHETIGIKDAKSFGLELPRHALGRGLESQAAEVVSQPVNAQVSSDGKASAEIINKAAVSVPRTQPPAARQKTDDGDDLGLEKLKAKADERDRIEKDKIK